MPEVNVDSPAVQSYLGILQGVINRTAANASGCKAWCISLVSAIMAILAGQGKPQYAFISIVPILLFGFLDSYYLGLEKTFRDQYDNFIHKLHTGTATVDDLFNVTPGHGPCVFLTATCRALASMSVWPFYGLLAAMMLFIRNWLLSA